jgi:hypothetical protein
MMGGTLVVVEDGGFYVKVEKVEGRWKRPRWVKDEDAVRAEKLAERLQKILDEFNESTRSFKASISIRYCKPSVCEKTKSVFYDVELEKDGEPMATITFEWNMTDDERIFVYIITDTYVTSLEDTLNILHLAGKLAVEFFKVNPTQFLY